LQINYFSYFHNLFAQNWHTAEELYANVLSGYCIEFVKICENDVIDGSMND